MAITVDKQQTEIQFPGGKVITWNPSISPDTPDTFAGFADAYAAVTAGDATRRILYIQGVFDSLAGTVPAGTWDLDGVDVEGDANTGDYIQIAFANGAFWKNVYRMKGISVSGKFGIAESSLLYDEVSGAEAVYSDCRIVAGQTSPTIDIGTGTRDQDLDIILKDRSLFDDAGQTGGCVDTRILGQIDLYGGSNLRENTLQAGAADTMPIRIFEGEIDDPQGANVTVLLTYVNTKQKLLADETYYVRATAGGQGYGREDNDANAFRTIQDAANFVMNDVDQGRHKITIQVADGAYIDEDADNATVFMANVSGEVEFVGNVATPGNVLTDVNYYGYAWRLVNCENVTVRGFKIKEASLFASGYAGIAALDHTNLQISDLRFEGDVDPVDPNICIFSGNHSTVITTNTDFTFANVASGVSLVQAENHSRFQSFVTFDIDAGEALSFASGTVTAINNSIVQGPVFSLGAGASIAAPRFNATHNSQIRMSQPAVTDPNDTLDFFPGSLPGVLDNSSTYGATSQTWGIDNFVNVETLTAAKTFTSANNFRMPLEESGTQVLSAALAQTVTLPPIAATTALRDVTIYNNGAASLTINNSPASLIEVLAPGSTGRYIAIDSGTDFVKVS